MLKKSEMTWKDWQLQEISEMEIQGQYSKKQNGCVTPNWRPEPAKSMYPTPNKVDSQPPPQVDATTIG